MTCACGETIVPRRPAGRTRAATSYETCLFQCVCGRGYSNSRDPAARTCIWRSPELNVPPEGLLALVAQLAEAPSPQGHAELLLWGVPTERDSGTRNELIAVLDDLKELSNCRSEPDVLVTWDDLVLVVEVKYLSGNEPQP